MGKIPAIDGGDGTRRGRVTEPNRLLAIRLLDAVRALHGTARPLNLGTTADHFSHLLERYGAEVEGVLDWTISNLKKVGVHSGAQFRRRYEQLRSSMRANPSCAQITEEARSIAKDSQSKYWPNGADQWLPLIVQTSLDNAAQFWERFKTVQASLPQLIDDARQSKKGSARHRYIYLRGLTGFVAHLRASNKICKPAAFVRRWLQLWADRLSSFRDWQGKPTSIIFRPDCEFFQRIGTQWAYAWFHRSEYWSVLMELINED